MPVAGGRREIPTRVATGDYGDVLNVLDSIGDSGCGKSPLLRLISGLEEKHQGDVGIGSRDVTLLDPKDGNVAMVFQFHVLSPQMSVFDNFAFALHIRGLGRAEMKAKVNEVAGILKLDQHLDRKTEQLRGRPGPGLLAHVLVNKYADHLPLYRQSGILERDGIDIDRSTLADWVGKSTVLLEPLADAIGRHVLAGQAILADDTPVKVLVPGTGTAKRATRSVAIERKNDLFVGSQTGGKAAAIAYTLIETAKLNGVYLQAWLADTLARIPDYKINRVDDLLPWKTTP